MFDDPKKELELLQEQLLQDEKWFEQELDSAKRMIGQMPEKKAKSAAAPRASARPAANGAAKTAQVRNYANGYGQAEPKSRTQNMQAEEEAPIPEKKSVKGLLILAGLETLGILGIAAYWVLVLLK